MVDGSGSSVPLGMWTAGVVWQVRSNTLACCHVVNHIFSFSPPTPECCLRLPDISTRFKFSKPLLGSLVSFRVILLWITHKV